MMQVSVEKISPIEFKLTIVVPEASVQAAIQEEVRSLSQTVSLPGFRTFPKGKMPPKIADQRKKIVEQRYGEEIKREAYGKVIQNSLQEALLQEKLVPVTTPNVQLKKPPVNGQDFEFTADIEIFPTIPECHFSLEKIEQPNVVVTEEDVDRVILQLRRQHTKFHAVERPSQLHDRLSIDFYSIYNDQEEKDKKEVNYFLELGGKSMIPGFEEELVGVNATEEKILDLIYPEDHLDVERAGKPVQFVVHINQVYEADIPELTEEFVKKLGIATGEISALRDNIKNTLEQEKDRLVRERIKKQVFDHLLENNQFPVPNSMIRQEAKNLHDEIYGHDHDHREHNHSSEELQQFTELAKKRLTLGILINEKAKQLEIKVDKNRVEMRAHEIASVYEDPEAVYQWLMSSERKSGIEAQILEEHVVDHLLQTVDKKELNLSYAELKGIHI